MKKNRPRVPVKKLPLNRRTKENLPGYPYYPEGEDIMNKQEEKLSIDIENPEHLVVDEKPVEENTSPDLVEGTTADVTNEDLRNLGDPDLAQDMGDDEDLKQRSEPVDIAATDLVVPGSELDDAQEEIGSEDEENNFYSHGDI